MAKGSKPVRSEGETARVSIPASQEPKGVVYTKLWVVELLLDLADYRAESNLVDAVAIEPAAGNGAFLGPMIDRLLDSCERQKRPIRDCVHAIAAYELDEPSSELARQQVVEQLKRRRVSSEMAEQLAASWVITGDYLLSDWDRRADFVIGNPPYVRLEDIPDHTASLYRHTYETMGGRADLYIAFFEAALKQLNDGGVCAFICADRWMRNQYGSDLRQLVSARFSIDTLIEMHRADSFHEQVDAYPAITILRRARQGPVAVAQITRAEFPGTTHLTLAQAVADTRDGRPTRMIEGFRIAKVDTWFSGREPWACSSPEQLALLRRLEKDFTPLEDSAKVGIGVATGNDRVFITRDTTLVEDSRLLKLARVDRRQFMVYRHSDTSA